MQNLDDEWVLYHALMQDLTLATQTYANGSLLTVVLSDGEVARYGLSPTSHLILRTLNGKGEVTVSADVNDLNWQVVNHLLHVTIDYNDKREPYEASFALTPNAIGY